MLGVSVFVILCILVGAIFALIYAVRGIIEEKDFAVRQLRYTKKRLERTVAKTAER